MYLGFPRDPTAMGGRGGGGGTVTCVGPGASRGHHMCRLRVILAAVVSAQQHLILTDICDGLCGACL